jgi:hypothetical protein
METGTEQDVENRVKEFIRKVGADGRLVITPTCCMPWRVPLNNIKAVTKAVEKWGAYPINSKRFVSRLSVINKLKSIFYRIRQHIIGSMFSRVHDDYRLQLINFILKFRRS